MSVSAHTQKVEVGTGHTIYYDRKARVFITTMDTVVTGATVKAALAALGRHVINREPRGVIIDLRRAIHIERDTLAATQHAIDRTKEHVHLDALPVVLVAQSPLQTGMARLMAQMMPQPLQMQVINTMPDAHATIDRWQAEESGPV